MQPEGQHERFYDLTAERSPSPWRYVPEDEVTDAYFFTGRGSLDSAEYLVAERNIKAAAICAGCEMRHGCPDRDEADAENFCLILRDAL